MSVRLDSVERAIEDIAAGKAVVVVGFVVWKRASARTATPVDPQLETVAA